MSFDPNVPPEEPSPVPPPPVEVPLTPAEITEGTGLPRNIAAALACIFLLVGGLAFYILDRRDRFVRLYALQSIVLSAVFLVLFLGLSLSGAILGIFPLVGPLFRGVFTIFSVIVEIGFVILWFSLIYHSYRGTTYEMPLLWKLAKRHLPAVLL